MRVRRNPLRHRVITELQVELLRLVIERLDRLFAVLILEIEQLQMVSEFFVPLLAISFQTTILGEYQLLMDQA